MIITNPYEIHVSLIWYCGHTSPQKWLIFEEYAKIKLPHTAYYRFNRFETAHTHRKQPLLHLQNENLIEKTFGFFSTCWRTIYITFHDVRSQCCCSERGLIWHAIQAKMNHFSYLIKCFYPRPAEGRRVLSSSRRLSVRPLHMIIQ